MLKTFQIERLCNIAYLDILISGHNRDNLADIMDYMLNEGFAESEKELPCMMTRAEWEQVARDIISDSGLGGLFVMKFVNDEQTGHRAFYFGSGNGEAYVVFRGTSGDIEWYDNGYGILSEETPAQKAALDFVINVRAEADVNYLCAAGHSKGGNKAQYCAVKAYSAVDSCVSVDGQGFSRLFIEKNSDVIEKARLKITAIAERRDFVNSLGFYLKEPLYYSGWRGTVKEDCPYGQPLPYFHCPDALRLQTGNIGGTSSPGEIAQISYISKIINEFATYFLTVGKYGSNREETVLGLVSLMTGSGGGEKAVEALAQAALVFFELAATSGSFRDDLGNMLIFEKEAAAATALMVKQSQKGTNGASGTNVVDKAMKRIAEKLLLKPAYFRYFIEDAERFVVFMNKAKEAKEHMGHISHFLKTIFAHIESLK